MRISIGSKATSRNGGNIFHYDRLFLVASTQVAIKLCFNKARVFFRLF